MYIEVLGQWEDFMESLWSWSQKVLCWKKGKHDHCPILLRESKVDYGPTPFRFFHSWLEIDGFHNLVIDTWKHDELNNLKNDHQSRLLSIDVKVDQGCATEEDFINCRESIKFLGDINRREASELAQKLKIKWALEVIAWYRKRKQELMVFKVDFEKAFDYIRWDFLDLVMVKLGFGFKWRSWIHGCLHNARSYILINGSPTSKFEIFRGQRQGDPLSLFLFILALEGLNAITCKSVDMEFLEPFQLGKYVLGNLPTYYMLIYMMLVTIQKKLEMMRNNFFIGGDESEKKITWVRWKKCLASTKLGGLGVGSIFALNMGLLFKWLWRFLCQPTDLWARVVKDIYRPNGGNDEEVAHSSNHSTWGAILFSVKRLKCKGCTVANRLQINDWSLVLRRNPRGGVESSQFTSSLSTIGAVSISDQKDSWLWSLDTSTGFTVASICSLIDDNTLDVDSKATRWNRIIPIKVNVFLWRLMLNKLATRVNLDRRGVDVGSILCLICRDDVESANHIFFSCDMAKDLWALLARWWELDIPIFDNFSEWVEWLNSLHLSIKAKLFLEGIVGTLLWSI
ncbi:RNA-directed DNA polymerase, eukaryota, reverse transcriptase zinc-binding domain protein [Tanacetum coccineum]